MKLKVSEKGERQGFFTFYDKSLELYREDERGNGQGQWSMVFLGKYQCLLIISRFHSLLSEMKLNFLVTAVVLLVAFPPPYECRAIDSSPNLQPPTDPDGERQSPPVLARLGEEYFIRLGNRNQNSPRSPPDSFPETSQYSKRALQLQLTQRLLEGKVGNIGRLDGSYALRALDSEERERRSEEPPISLDLTFHLLREVLEMARAEQMAQQAHSNRKMMEIFGK
ncbi:hypothetical protein DNTS_009714 [Danionella cerebrum]|uniref:Corticotropin-releasing factor domain-containing protein n=1 Tax=Danionella cerebrum TaxID=2873325 RepID=A0A553RJG4_9TELE|nr:hypothetical protein DNTS_009714 [Danionella translucida]